MTAVRRRLAAFVATTIGATLLAFGVAAPPEHCPDLTVVELRDAARATAGWLIDNQEADGRWLYEYDRSSDVAIDDYNVVRHAGVMSSLYQAGARGIDGAIDSADRGLAWALDNTVERHGWIGVTDGNLLQAGTNALLLAALVERRLATGDEQYDTLMDGLARFLVDQMEDNGALLAYYDLQPDVPRADTYSIYYTGETYWALGRLHGLDPAAGWGRAADRMGNYMATIRDDAENVWPQLADHWAGYGLAETAAFPDRPDGEPLTEAELEFVSRQGGLIGQRVRSISQRFGPWGAVVRGTFTPRGGGYGVFGEGLAGLWRAAQLDERLIDERAPLAERALCITSLAVEAQADTEEAAGYASPDRVEGAWFIDDITRMDDQQHALSALLFTMPILEAQPFDTGSPSPAIWVWLLVILGTVNPIRLALATSRDGAVRERMSRVAAGASVGAVALLAVGALSGWLLGAVDTSAPAIRLAAGSLCLLSAGIDLASRPRVEQSDLGGWQSAIVPIAVPLFVRPALVVAGLSAVADHGLGVYAVLLALTVAASAASSALPLGAEAADLTDRRYTISVWVARLLSALAVAASVLLIADAVFDI